MVTAISHSQSPEEQELERKLVELNNLRSALAESELILASLRADTADFNRQYLRVVGLRYAELDRLQAEVAEWSARIAPSDLQKRTAAQEARTKADQTYESVRGEATAAQEPSVSKSETLKKLYREVAKSVHPDLANDPNERECRERFMARANEAYRKGDEKALESILQEWKYSPDIVKGDGLEADLIRTLRKVAQVKARIAQIEEQIVELESGELYQLYQNVTKADAQGRDLLSEMALAVDVRIRAAAERLAQLRTESMS